MFLNLVRKIPWLELIRFGATGLFSVALYLGCLVPLNYVLPNLLWLAAALAYGASMVANYLMQRNFTFRSNRRHEETVVRYLLVHAVAMGLNSGVLELLIRRLSVSLWLAQGTAVVCVAIWSYSAQKLWVFLGRGHAPTLRPDNVE